MFRSPQLPENKKSGDNEYVHVRCLVANIHKPKNVSRPPTCPDSPLESSLREESPSSMRECSPSVSEISDVNERSENSEGEQFKESHEIPTRRVKSNSIAGGYLMPPSSQHNKRRRPTFLHLNVGGGHDLLGPFSAGTHLNLPRFTVTAPPGEGRRLSHGFPFHGFALRRHSNTVNIQEI
ncbi:unnamed protein product [Leptidea sinapis]|uniref:Uncharacterized protein n=1 Tax=Leptidea sinapis TaxID=189913 RepID=A0A5E4QNU4_9NEOP|nr:unnamed protein product [Leptidea sinapis]